MNMRRYWAVGAALVLIGAAAVSVHAQVQYARGQDVAPVFEGWEANPDGSFNMVFGYLNRNYQEELDIPIGPNNTIDLGGDAGQPTHFYPRRQRFIFRVRVPKDWDKDKRVTWTLTSRGRTNRAKGWLQPEWELNEGVIAENSGGEVLVAGNMPPALSGPPDQTVTLPGTVTLTATATDDGLPKTRPRSPGSTRSADPDSDARRQQGVRLRWIYYRGPGKVVFDPENAPVAYGVPVTLTSKVSFSAPGMYLIKAVASDGQLMSTHDVTITVK
jgi:hypothetical protein